MFEKRTALLICASLWTLGAASAAHSSSAESVVATWHGSAMFEDFSVRTQVSPDGHWIVRTSADGIETLFGLPELKPAPAVMGAGLDNVERLVFCGKQSFLRLGTKGQTHAWFGPGSESTAGDATNIPLAATPACSLDGKHVAHFTSYPPRRELPPPTEIFAGSVTSQNKVELGSVPTGAVYASDGNVLYVIARQADGASSIFAVDTRASSVKRITSDLDAWPFNGVHIAISPDDSKLVVALASLQKPANAQRQQPYANRWLSIATVDAKTGAVAMIRNDSGHDLTDAAVAGADLYWVHIDVTKSVVALPASGGMSHAVIGGIEAYQPAWSRDGKRLAYVFGQYRLADWALSQDIGIVDIDANAQATTSHKVFIEGTHEDFPPDWSPNGKWIVWHSHRSTQGNPAYYDAPGTTDSIYIRAAEDVHAPERNLSGQLWETGWAYWSPDGTKVIYTSWDRDGEPGKYHVIVANVDPDTGRTLKTQRLTLPESILSPQFAEWSPDGKEIAIEDASTMDERTLWIASADGRTARKVTNYRSHTYGGASWMPDGKTLVFAALDGDHMQIYSVARDGTNVRRLSDGHGNLVGPRVSPDGKWIACSRVDTTQKLMKASW